jgi:hypothetical protein
MDKLTESSALLVPKKRVSSDTLMTDSAIGDSSYISIKQPMPDGHNLVEDRNGACAPSDF